MVRSTTNRLRPNREPEQRGYSGWIIGSLAVLAISTGTAFLLTTSPVVEEKEQVQEQPWPVDPRLDAATTYRNAHPDVKYVGDATCATCHSDIVQRYRHHPMGKSLAPIRQMQQIESFDRAEFTANGFVYRVEKYDDQIFHVESKLDASGRELFRKKAEVIYALGSGTTGRSYLIRRAKAALHMSPITWYSDNKLWQLSPGYDKFNYHFERAIKEDCLFCHSNPVKRVIGTRNRYQEPIFEHGHAIGCERCHGPGELHVRLQNNPGQEKLPDDTIVNPGKLSPTLRDAVCEQCHLLGEERVVRLGRKRFDYRPGLPLNSILAVFVRPKQNGDKRLVSHVEQMVESRCYKDSNGRLGCISCHDPHRTPKLEEKVTFYRTKCLTCHDDSGTPCNASMVKRKKVDDSCFHCHMPRHPSADISHTSVTDHRVPRNPQVKRPLQPQRLIDSLVNFHASSEGAGISTSDRDLGIALANSAFKHKMPRMAAKALPYLEKSLTKWPDDTRARRTYGDALGLLGRYQDALVQFKKSLELEPNEETALLGAAAMAELMRKPGALKYQMRLVEINPAVAEYHASLSRHLLKTDPTRAVDFSQRALELNPASIFARRVHIESLLRSNQLDEAKAQYKLYQQLGAKDADRIQSLLGGALNK